MTETANCVAGPLAREIAAMIAMDGPISVARYMEIALGHPRHGYYMTRDPLGRRGDFTTAPEISQIFGELIAVWCVQAWRTMGSPDKLAIIEIGPGRATLMADLLRALAALKAAPRAIEGHLVETSPTLRRVQKATLAAAELPLFWHDRLEDMSKRPAIIIANEVFDALPIHQLVFHNAGWHERVVGLDRNGGLTLGLAAGMVARDITHALKDRGVSPRDGSVLEISPARRRLAAEIAGFLAESGGFALIMDYGHGATGFGDTLQAVRAHRFAEILERPGDVDLSAHVDFADLVSSFTGSGCVCHGPLSQGCFLDSLGLDLRARTLRKQCGPEERADLDAAVNRLAGRGNSDMGELFKVLAAANPRHREPYPFGPGAPKEQS